MRRGLAAMRSPFRRRDGSATITSVAGAMPTAAWVGTETAGLVRYRAADVASGGGGWQRFGAAQGLANDFVRPIHEDREGSLWVGTNGGLNRFRAGKLTPWGKLEGLSHDFTRAIFEDRDGVLWLGTDGGGASRRVGGVWSALRTADGLSHDSVRAIAQTSDGAIWLGTRNGVDRYAGGRITNFGDRLPSRLVRALAADGAGNLWIGMEGGGLARLRDGALTTFTPRDGLGADDVRSILVDRHGVLWAGTYGGGLSRFDGRRFTTLRVADGLPNDIVFALHEDAAGLWVGTDSGLALLPRRPGHPDRPDGQVATSGRFPSFGIDDGLADDKVFRILATATAGCGRAASRRAPRGRGRRWRLRRQASQRRLDHLHARRRHARHAGNGASQPRAGRRATAISGPHRLGVWRSTPTTSGSTACRRLAIESARRRVPVELARRSDLAPDLERLRSNSRRCRWWRPTRCAFATVAGSDRDWVERRPAHRPTPTCRRKHRFAVRAANSDGIWNHQAASSPHRRHARLAHLVGPVALRGGAGGGGVGAAPMAAARAGAANALLGRASPSAPRCSTRR